MKALILNSGIGSRAYPVTNGKPKCLLKISENDVILSRQLRILNDLGIKDVVITTGENEIEIINHCKMLGLPINITFVRNDLYDKTNYIYSIYKAREFLNDDLILLHGDLVFDREILRGMIDFGKSCVSISTTSLPTSKDFKAVILDDKIHKIGIEYTDNSVSSQPLYCLNYNDWRIWLDEIIRFCENNKTDLYAEEAFNNVSERINLYAFDTRDLLCQEIDTKEDFEEVKNKMNSNEKLVYMCFSTDIIHSGHLSIIREAQKLGKLMIGVLSDEAVISYKRFPLLPYEERKSIFENLKGVETVVEQKTLSYKDNIEKFKPDYIVHGDDWTEGIQKPIREEVISVLSTYGGKLIEFPYSDEEKYIELEKRARIELSNPELRRARLNKSLRMKGLITALEAHSGLTGLLVEKSTYQENGGVRQFDAIWVSSLCDSTAKGKPDIELVDMTSRFRTIDDICEVTTKPIIFDGDTGGAIEHFVYTVRTLERMGVSMIIIEDKTGLKKNSLFGNEVLQTQDSIDNFSKKIRAGKMAKRTKDFMICARIESLILEKGQEDALNRAIAYVEAGADAIMIHSRKKDPTEIFEFVEKFRGIYSAIPLVVVPTSFNEVTEEEFKKRGVNIVIYANQLTRAAFPAMQNAANLILKHHRAKECDEICMPFNEIIRLIPEE